MSVTVLPLLSFLLPSRLESYSPAAFSTVLWKLHESSLHPYISISMLPFLNIHSPPVNHIEYVGCHPLDFLRPFWEVMLI